MYQYNGDKVRGNGWSAPPKLVCRASHPPTAPGFWPQGEMGVLTVIMITVMEQTPHLLAGLIAASTSARPGDRWAAGGLAAGALGGLRCKRR